VQEGVRRNQVTPIPIPQQRVEVRVKATPLRRKPLKRTSFKTVTTVVKKRRTKSERTKRIGRIDTLWSIAVRTRDNYTCQYCGAATKRSEAHHIFGRTAMSTRFDLEDGVTLCWYCHHYRAPSGQFHHWAEHEWLGEAAYEALHERLCSTVKTTDEWLDEQEARLRAEIEKLQEKVFA
jgi:5-methylcytosine-specific restriction endonuclease McrA